MRFLLILLTSAACAWSQSVPDTPAGRTLQFWLDAFNSGERGRIQAYHTNYEPAGSVEGTIAFRNQSGGFELLGVDKSEPLYIEFHVKEKANPTIAVGSFTVKDGNPAQVVNFRLRAIPQGLTAADMNPKIDAATRARVIDGAIANLNEFYVFPDTAKKNGRSGAGTAEEGRVRLRRECGAPGRVAHYSFARGEP